MQAALSLAGRPAEGFGPQAPATDWSLLDDPAEWSAFGRALDADTAAGRWESQVVVEGMHCAACAFTVEAALARVPGVLQADNVHPDMDGMHVYAAVVARAFDELARRAG